MSKKNDMKSINDSDSETSNKKKDGYFGRMSAKVPIPKGDFVGVKSAKDFTSYPGEWVKLACKERGISNEQLEKAILERKLRIVTSDGDVLNPPPAEFIKHLVNEALFGNYEFCRSHADSFFKIKSEFITDKAIQKVKKNESYEKSKKIPFSIHVPEGTTWGQINVRIVNASYIQVTYPGAKNHENIDRETIGLTQKPWDYLVKLARDRGEYIPEGEEEKKGAPGHFKAMRAAFKNLFPTVKGKPIGNQNRRTGVYKSALSISIDPKLMQSNEVQDAISDTDEIRRKKLQQLIKEQQEDRNSF